MSLGPVLLACTRHLRLHPVLAVLAVVGIALGVAMSSGIDLAIASSHRAFAASVVGVSGSATDQILAGPSGIKDGEVARIRGLLAPAHVAPVVESLVGVRGHPGRSLRLIGIDPIAEAPFVTAGAPALLDASSGSGSGATLMTRADTIALSASTARGLGVMLGGSLELVVGASVRRVVVAVLLPDGDQRQRRLLGDLALCDIATAQELLERLGRIDRIDLLVGPGQRAGLDRLRLPEGARLAPSGSQGQALQQMTRAFDLNLTAMGLLALVVGVFLIFNTIDFLTVQRRDLMARLRLHGARRGALAGAILIEAAALGLAGSTLGLLLGIGCAHLLVAGVTRTISDLWFQVAVHDLSLPPLLLAGNLAMGVLAALAAAMPAALLAMRITPAAGAVASLHAERSRRALPGLALLGCALLLLSWLLLCWGPGSITAGFVVMAGCIGGSALLVPPLLAWALRAAARPLAALGGPLASIAARSFRGHHRPHRTCGRGARGRLGGQPRGRGHGRFVPRGPGRVARHHLAGGRLHQRSPGGAGAHRGCLAAAGGGRAPGCRPRGGEAGALAQHPGREHKRHGRARRLRPARGEPCLLPSDRGRCRQHLAGFRARCGAGDRAVRRAASCPLRHGAAAAHRPGLAPLPHHRSGARLQLGPGCGADVAWHLPSVVA